MKWCTTNEVRGENDVAAGGLGTAVMVWRLLVGPLRTYDCNCSNRRLSVGVCTFGVDEEAGGKGC